ncbi:hypothetical protein BH10BDE1_BH10BDE1_09480 [soil metagenome]
MKTSAFVLGLASTIAFAASAQAAAPVTYLLSITNGSQMPLSPAVIYTKVGSAPAAEIGTEATTALIQLCQMGKADVRKAELLNDKTTTFATATTAMLFPGETKVVEVEVQDPKTQSIHFETMYGKTKDVCGVASFSSHNLIALNQHVTTNVRSKDDVILTGAFADPRLPAGMVYIEPSVCASAADATSCVRELAVASPGTPIVRFFAGYFPSLVTALETKYGSKDVGALLIPTSGAIRFDLKLKH